MDTVTLPKIDPRVKYHSYIMSGIILRIGHTRPYFNPNVDGRIDDKGKSQGRIQRVAWLYFRNENYLEFCILIYQGKIQWWMQEFWKRGSR